MVKDRIDALDEFRKQLEGADVDLLREMVKVFAEQLMGADADALCGADYGERSPEVTGANRGRSAASIDMQTSAQPTTLGRD